MKTWKPLVALGLVLGVGAAVGVGIAGPAPSPMEAWKPKFDPKTAKYVMKVSAVSTPAIEAFAVGYKIRDALWEKTNGQLYYDYYPLSQLGGEVEVLNQLTIGAVQGMLCSSVVAPKIGPRMGIINLPFLVNSFDKLDKFVKDKPLFDHMLAGALDKGVMGVDVTTYGNYGWASDKPIRKIADAKPLKFRIAEADVNQSIYKAWGFNIVPMPWPDVHIALKQGVIDALDHTAIVCNLTKKFEVAKYFTQIDYAQGLLIHMYNKKFVDSLPKDIQKTLLDVTREECAKAREAGRKQEDAEIAKAKAAGIEFIKLPESEIATLRKQSQAVFREWDDKIGVDYLKKVEALLGYKP
ncbi:MAG: TRAP transporter substrate-binding protein [Deltaproteobacteria bacterium]|nr:TRAP transporter substrate-binding protein [Deltaproteobacteria bacterium]